MASKSGRIKSLVSIAEGEENDAARELRTAIEQLERTEKSLKDLQTYQTEYIAQYNQSTGKQTTIQQLNQYRNFLTQIDAGISQQYQVIAQAQKEVEIKRQFWLDKHNRTRALLKAMENYLLEEQQEQNQKEQKLQDEFSARIKK